MIDNIFRHSMEIQSFSKFVYFTKGKFQVEKMQVNWKFIFLVGVVAYLWYPSNEHDILVLVNSSTFAIARLKEIKNLKAAFKISRNIYNEIKEVPDSFKTEVRDYLA